MNQPLTDPAFPAGDFARGSLTAFEKVYDAFRAGVLRFARELVQDTVVAQGIVTDSFLKLWIQHADLNSSQNIEAFLHISIQRSCFSYLKQVEQLNAVQLKKMQAALSAGTASAQEMKDSAAMKAIILGWFKQLPDPAGEVARLLYEEALTGEEVAARLGIPASQVKDQKLKAMLLIKEQWFSKTEKELTVFRDLLQKAKG
jgi:RNA polymerase sigma factor (sigma-70 family)